MGNGLSSDQGSFTPHGLRDVDRFGAEQRQHDWSNPENNNQLAGAAPNHGELNSLSKFNRRQTRLESVDCGGEQINSEPSSSPNSHNYSKYSTNFGGSVFRCVLWLNDTSTAKVSQEVSRKCRARNTTTQLSTTFTDHNDRQRYIRTVRQTTVYDANGRSYCVTVLPAKTEQGVKFKTRGSVYSIRYA